MHLARAWEQLAAAESEEAVALAVKATGRAISGADGITFVRREGEYCHYVLEDAVAPLWAGQRFPVSACISGWCMLHNRPAVITDIFADSRIPANAYRQTFVASLAMVPVGKDEPIASIGAYWATKHEPSSETVMLLQQLAHAASFALSRIARTDAISKHNDPDLFSDVAKIQSIPAVQTILNVVCEITGMGFAAVARVTEDRWIACEVRDLIAFGLKPGEELDIRTTLCNEVRETQLPIIIDDVQTDPVYRDHHTPAQYGLNSYIAMPIIRKDGSFFGTLCAIDPSATRPSRSEVVAIFRLFAELIACHLDSAEQIAVGIKEIERQRKDDQLREEFIGVLGHDLRNPLAAVDAGITLLTKRSPRQDQLATLDLMKKSVSRMSGLIEDVLDFTRGRLAGGLTISRSDGSKLRVALQDIIDECALSSETRTINSEIAINSDVACDVPRIGQLLSNLLSNALTHGAPNAPVDVSALTRDGVFRLAVSNAGRAIPQSMRDKLFEPYTREQSSGLGLGLYICSEIARAHGGSLDVTSNSARTTFTFEMPLV